MVFTILTNLYSVTVQYWIFVGEKHMLLIFFQTAEVPFLDKKFTYIYILQTRHFSILFCFVYLFLLIHPSHIKYTTSVVYLGCKPNAVLLLPFFNIKQKKGKYRNRLILGLTKKHISNKMKVFISIWEVATVAIRSKYLKELFTHRRLPFFPFPLLMMLCLVNFLFPQVEGIKWNCRGSLHKIYPWKCWCVLYGLQKRRCEFNTYTSKKIISYSFVPFFLCLALKKHTR